MDGATNVNPSNAPHVSTSREEKRVERSIAKEATVAEKQVAQVGKTLKSAEKDEGKAEKVCLPTPGTGHPYEYIDTADQATQKAQRAREKAVKQEHKTAQALTDAQHKHDLAVANEKKAVNDLSVRLVILFPAAPKSHSPVTTCKPCSCVVTASLASFGTADVSEAPSGSPSNGCVPAY